MTKQTFWVESVEREYAYEPLSDFELGVAAQSCRENLTDPKNRTWGIDIMTLRLIDRLLTAEAKVTALQEEIARMDAVSERFVAALDVELSQLRAAILAKAGA